MKPSIIKLHAKDTEGIDWKKVLSSYLKKNYGPQQWSYFFDEALAKELNHLRTNANSELAPESLLEQNLKYYCFIEQLDMRLGNRSTQLKLNFTWYDVDYSTNTKVDTKYTQHTLTFEKSCIIFNIGTLFTQVAEETLVDDYKKSITAMTKAIACFTYLAENFFNSPSIDLHAENTQFLANLCHAQAQELFLLKLINNPSTTEKQSSLISKLAITTYELYDQCSTFLKKPEGGIIVYGEPRWNTNLSCKAYLYRSIAAHYYSISLEQQNKFGEAIAFSKYAHTSLISALPFKAWLKDYIDFNGLKETIELKTQQLIKDNDYIYHDSIPQGALLETIKAMDAIRPIKWNELVDPYMQSVSEKCNILYKGIVPMKVYEKESIYSEQKASLLRREVEANDTSNLEFDSFIEYTKLPVLLTDLEKRYKSGRLNNKENPQLEFMRDQLRLFSKNVQSSVYSDIQEQTKLITTKRKEIVDTLSQLPESQKENTVKIKSSLLEASKSDEKLLSLVKPYLTELSLLMDNNTLWSQFNQYDDPASSEPSLLDIDDTKTEKILQELNGVKLLYVNLTNLKQERNAILLELKEAINNDDITSKLINLKNAADTEIQELFNKELEKFEPLSSRLEAAIYKQVSLINEIKIDLDKIFTMSGFREKNMEETKREKERKHFFDNLEKAATNFSIFASDIQKGLYFYDRLLSMSKELLESSKTNANNSIFSNNNNLPSPVPPTLPEQPSKLKNKPTINSYVGNSLDSLMNNLDNQFGNLNINSSVPNPNMTNAGLPPKPPKKIDSITGVNNYYTVQSAPEVPARTYHHNVPSIPLPPSSEKNISLLDSSTTFTRSFVDEPPAYSNHRNAPQVPLRQPVSEHSNILDNNAPYEDEERELQRNPTAFYNKSPVFDENMYFKYGK
ncbi:Bro1p PWA37_002274 [Arxiozyma heterogenica]|uniref:BRO domain-containing protein 1 n=1 Tax=Arxiozyma heterogenica TaxID=278026 RepID=A0AAN7WFY0_9SACH|nr:hypothetical protein RI543_003653 [Kazachstania heterogenica]